MDRCDRRLTGVQAGPSAGTDLGGGLPGTGGGLRVSPGSPRATDGGGRMALSYVVAVLHDACGRGRHRSDALRAAHGPSP